MREKLIELVNNVLRHLPWGEISSHTAEDVADHLIANGVTVQKHGRWLLDGRCSECLENPLTTHKTYCPNCGAKMDGERKDNGNLH